MHEKFGPVQQSLVYYLECLGIVGRQPDTLPPLRWQMRSLDSAHVEIQSAGGGVSANRGIAGVGEGTGLPIAEAGDVVLIAAKVLLFCSPTIVGFLLAGEKMGSIICGTGSFSHDNRQTYLSLKEQNCWFITCQTISSDAIASVY